MSRGAFITLAYDAEVEERPFVQTSTGLRDRHPSLEAFKSEWRACRLSTAAADRAAAEKGVHLAYREAGLASPRIIWSDGPVELAKAWAAAFPRAGVGASVKDVVIDRPYYRAMRQIGMLADDRVEAAHDLFACDRSCVVSAAIESAVIEEAGAIGPSLLTWLLAPRGGGRSQRRPTFANCGWSQHQLCGLAFCAYPHGILDREVTRPLRGLWLVAKNAGWLVPHERMCWLADRPDVLCSDQRGRLHCASGPALRYRDGWARYAWKGVSVPPWIIMQPEQITLPWIDAQIDPLVRRAMIDILTPERFIDEGGADRIASDAGGTLWRRQWTHRGTVIDAWAAVEFTSRNGDGSVKRTFQCVPAQLRTPREALACIFGPEGEGSRHIKPASLASLVGRLPPRDITDAGGITSANRA